MTTSTVKHASRINLDGIEDSVKIYHTTKHNGVQWIVRFLVMFTDRRASAAKPFSIRNVSFGGLADALCIKKKKKKRIRNSRVHFVQLFGVVEDVQQAESEYSHDVRSER